MKDKENIKNINKLSISYMMLSGLNGKSLGSTNPFLKYLAYNMLMNGFNEKLNNSDGTENDVKTSVNKVIYIIDPKNGLESSTAMIPNELVHMMIEESYEMYKKLDKMEIIDKKVSEDISLYLNKDYDDFLDDLYNKYVDSFLSILINFSSNRESYNLIKIKVYEEELKKSVKVEDYDKAIFYRDRIKDLNDKIDKNRKKSEI